MNTLAVLSVAAVSLCWAHPARSPTPDWSPPGPDDFRGPCPMLNSLANHHYLPHDGRNFDNQTIIEGLGTALNIDASFASFLFGHAITTNPEANATAFSLHDLGRHNILEHDASLSRQDAYFGPPDKFDAAVFAETQSYWHGPVLDTEMAVRARAARIRTSSATNPKYSMSPLGNAFSLGESAAYLMVFGDIAAGTAPREPVEYLFENERLPFELGWKRSENAITYNDLEEMMERMAAIMEDIDPEVAKLVRRDGIHG